MVSSYATVVYLNAAGEIIHRSLCAEAGNPQLLPTAQDELQTAIATYAAAGSTVTQTPTGIYSVVPPAGNKPDDQRVASLFIEP
jgi:hypothetical protein